MKEWFTSRERLCYSRRYREGMIANNAELLDLFRNNTEVHMILTRYIRGDIPTFEQALIEAIMLLVNSQNELKSTLVEKINVAPQVYGD